ncbi:TMEM175 family protein [Deinococcus yavapaiensis]|uniref:Putative membrane protein n=1 Tax=Deinococcus yavapaiensis KR-236 TaxID=694435 RepID=A0A318SBP8_9DEIO|nr:TMEM175 family protein [Deinococcus yavapaiensis]PYE54167.1 putative membrane protein [Deinococcus yavapaiensis KR-236]
MFGTSAQLEKDRLDTLIDGVFAIVLTLLVLEVKLPEDVMSAAVPQELIRLIPRLAVYAVTFITTALLWATHYYYASLVEGTDFWHITLNLLTLLFVSLLPFSASVMGAHPDSPWGVAVGFLNFALVGLALTFNWMHCIRRRRLVKRAASPQLLRSMLLVAWVYCVFAFGDAALALWSPVLAIELLGAWLVVGFVVLALLQPHVFAAARAPQEHESNDMNLRHDVA